MDGRSKKATTDKQRKLMKRKWRDPEYRERVSASQKKRYKKKPGVKKKIVKMLRSPEMKEAASKGMKEYWIRRKAQEAAQSENNSEGSSNAATD